MYCLLRKKHSFELFVYFVLPQGSSSDEFTSNQSLFTEHHETAKLTSTAQADQNSGFAFSSGLRPITRLADDYNQSISKTELETEERLLDPGSLHKAV